MTGKDPCKFGECRRQSVYYVVYGCADMHVADSTACQKHLMTIRTMIAERKFRCHCGKPHIKGLYRRIDSTGRACIITRDMNGQIVTTIKNTSDNRVREMLRGLTSFENAVTHTNAKIADLDKTVQAAERKTRNITETSWHHDDQK